MKTIITILLFLLASFANGQPIYPVIHPATIHPLLANPLMLNLPHHKITPSDTFGKVIYTKLTNTTSHSITLHPLLTPMHSTDSASLVQGVLNQLTPTNDTDSIRIQLLQIVGHYIKSPNKNSFMPNLRDENEDSIVNREYSLIGSDFSFPSLHCGQVCREAIFLLEATKFFSDSDLLINSTRGHTTMQIKLTSGDTVYADMAVTKPVFMVKNHLKSCGWASLSDIINDTSLINEQSIYYYINQQMDTVMGRCQVTDISEYQMLFTQSWQLSQFHASRYHLDNFTGDFILAAGQSIEYRDTIGYVIDTTIAENQEILYEARAKLDSFTILGEDVNSIYLDSALYYYYQPYAAILNIPISEAISLFDDGKILLYSNSSNWTPSYFPSTSVIYSSIPSTSDTTYFGIQTSAPLIITKSTSITNNTTVDTFSYNSFYGQTVFASVPYIVDSQLNYANGIGKFNQIMPNTSIQQELMYNYNIFNFYTGGQMFSASDTGILIQSSSDIDSIPDIHIHIPTTRLIDELGGLGESRDSLTLMYSNKRNDTDSVSGLNQLPVFNINTYPNPASDVIQISITNPTSPLSVNLFDINGKLIFKSSIENSYSIDVSSFYAGVYLLQILDSETPMIIQYNKKIAIIR